MGAPYHGISIQISIDQYKLTQELEQELAYTRKDIYLAGLELLKKELDARLELKKLNDLDNIKLV